MQQSLAVFGATGTIGDNTLDLVDRHDGRFRVSVLTAHDNIAKLATLAEKYHPDMVVVSNAAMADEARAALSDYSGEVAFGASGLAAAAAYPADIAVMAIVGFAALTPTLALIEAGRHIALANKECLVAAGGLIMQRAAQCKARILPVDSEHNAIFQLLDGRNTAALERVVLTASGGPFLDFDAHALAAVTPDMAKKHPNWQMGAKISVDSATMMNKGLELIEAHHLFALPPAQLDVLVHPQSIVHGLVYFADGAVLAHKANADMRIPLSYCLAYPERLPLNPAPLDLVQLGRLDFLAPDRKRFRCLALAEAAMRAGGLMPTILNGANEVAVAAFLDGHIGFTDIADYVEAAMESADRHGHTLLADDFEAALEQIIACDFQTRENTGHLIAEKRAK